jgi:hypothetical protein
MREMARVTDIQALARSLDALIAFADQEGNFVLAATLDAARVQFSELYEHSKD